MTGVCSFSKSPSLFCSPSGICAQEFGSHLIGRTRICINLLFARRSIGSKGFETIFFSARLFKQRFETVAKVLHREISKLGTLAFSSENKLTSLRALFFLSYILVCYSVDWINIPVAPRESQIFTCRSFLFKKISRIILQTLPSIKGYQNSI